MFKRTVGVVSFWRSTDELQRQAEAGFTGAERGSFGIRLAVNGLAVGRAAEITRALGKRFPDAPVLPSPDENEFQLFSVTTMPLGAAALAVVSQFIADSRQAGLESRELLDATASLWVSPVDPEQLAVRSPSGLRGKLAKRSERLAQKLFVVSAEAFDEGSRQRHGDRSYTVSGTLSGIDDDSVEALSYRARVLCGQIPDLSAGELRFDVACEQVGTPLGALLLFLRKCAQLLAKAPADSSLALHVNPAE